jgi:uncharacterized protein YndB with AHSA1/START domain
MAENKQVIVIEAIVNAPVEKVFDFWTKPEHIVNWSYASDDWHTPTAENDLSKGGKFSSRMEAKDGSMGFDFGGVYDEVIQNKYIEYTLGDGRKVKINFNPKGDHTEITESFEAEKTNPLEMQKSGWQAILNNFKKYAEAQ